ncbi:hypothetical protein EU546_01285 [Candidatus Thorarchaeota archaeon]|nr:MAG: hypothetical protein EU546_01285 [Candidatus Thorarchaeota archaeon]
MHAEIVTLTVMIGCIPCIIHSWLTRGKWMTAAFFVGGFVFGIVRENIVALMPTLYTYPNHPVYIGAAPLMMGFGWSASFYASWCVAERLLEGFAPQQQTNIWSVALVTGVVTGLLSIPVEVAAGAPETLWWVWPAEAIDVLWEMPAIVPFGWAGAGILFVAFFIKAMRNQHSPVRNASFFVLSTLIVIFLHLAYVMGVRTIIAVLLSP